VTADQARTKQRTKQIDQFAPEDQADQADQAFQHFYKKEEHAEKRGAYRDARSAWSAWSAWSLLKKNAVLPDQAVSVLGPCLVRLASQHPGITDPSPAHGRQREGLPKCKGLSNNGRASGQPEPGASGVSGAPRPCVELARLTGGCPRKRCP
jgi:hypothetical protein